MRVKVRCRPTQDGQVESRLTFKHTEHKHDHVLLQTQELSQQLQLGRIFAQLVHHVSKEEEESVDSVPKTTVG